MFKLTNYKAAPFSALSFWANKTARNRFYKDTRGWSEETHIVANSECTEVEVARAVSLLLEYAVTTTKTNTKPLSFVQLHMYDRGDVALEVGEWIAFKQAEQTQWQLGMVIDLLLLKFGVTEEYYVRCGRMINLANVEFNEDSSSVKVALHQESEEVFMQVDHSLSLCDVHADVQGAHVTLTYYM